MGVREDREIIAELKSLREGVRDGLGAIALESRKQTVFLTEIYKILSSGGFPLPVENAVTGEMFQINDDGQEVREKMLFKADFEGIKKFRVLTRDKKGNLSDVQDGSEKMEHSDVIESTLAHVGKGTYEGTFKLTGKVGETQLNFMGDGDKSDGEKIIRAILPENITVIEADADVAQIEVLPDEVEVPVDPAPVDPVPVDPAPVDPTPEAPAEPARSKPLRAGASRNF